MSILFTAMSPGARIILMDRESSVQICCGMNGRCITGSLLGLKPTNQWSPAFQKVAQVPYENWPAKLPRMGFCLSPATGWASASAPAHGLFWFPGLTPLPQDKVPLGYLSLLPRNSPQSPMHGQVLSHGLPPMVLPSTLTVCDPRPSWGLLQLVFASDISS